MIASLVPSNQDGDKVARHMLSLMRISRRRCSSFHRINYSHEHLLGRRCTNEDETDRKQLLRHGSEFSHVLMQQPRKEKGMVARAYPRKDLVEDDNKVRIPALGEIFKSRKQSL